MATDFEEFMDLRLAESRDDEATAVVLDLWDGRRLEDAVLDAIESLPDRKTRDLRRWVDQYVDYLQWLSLEEEGWEMEKLWWEGALPQPGSYLMIAPPKKLKDALITGAYPHINSFLKEHGLSDAVVAAAAGARQVDMNGVVDEKVRGAFTGAPPAVARSRIRYVVVA